MFSSHRYLSVACVEQAGIVGMLVDFPLNACTDILTSNSLVSIRAISGPLAFGSGVLIKSGFIKAVLRVRFGPLELRTKGHIVVIMIKVVSLKGYL